MSEDIGPSRRHKVLDAAHAQAVMREGGYRREAAFGGGLALPAAPLVLAGVGQSGPGHKRQVKTLSVSALDVHTPETGPPTFEWVDPKVLLVDEAYQRALSERSVSLIRKIIGHWDWRRFKPPVVARTEAGLEVIDGQHTAIAAASHPAVATIPVMVVDAVGQADRAAAFIGHNRDRLNITPGQMHAAALTAGDTGAQQVARVCETAGVKVLRGPPGNGAYKAGDTVALVGITALIHRQGEKGAIQILSAIVKAGATPVGAAHIKAFEMLLHEGEYVGQVTAEELTQVMLAMGDGLDREARIFAAAHQVQIWRAMGVVLFKRATKGKRRAGVA